MPGPFSSLANESRNFGNQISDFAQSFAWLRPDAPNVGGAIGMAGEEARKITNEQNLRQIGQFDFLTDQFNEANQATITDQDIDLFFSREADGINADSAQLQSNLRESLGESGIQGGEAAGLGASVELQRLGQLSGARRDLRIFKANADAQDRINQYQRAAGLAAFRSQGPSEYFSNFLSSNVDAQLALYGIDKSQEAADKQREANEDAAIFDFFSSAAGAVLPLL